METQIKEETKETSLCFENTDDNITSLSILEKYDRFLQNDQSDADSDVDFFPDETVLKEEYAQLRSDSANYTSTNKNNRLSTGLPGKHRSYDPNLSAVYEEPRNGTACETSGDLKSGLISLNELIEKLESIRKCDTEGNSIFCTESELEAIQERYGEILDFIHEKSSTFERTSSSKDLTTQQPDDEQSDEHETECLNNRVKSEDLKLLEEKMDSVRRARDRFYEVEQIVREQIEQLELVERYMMESVG